MVSTRKDCCMYYAVHKCHAYNAALYLRARRVIILERGAIFAISFYVIRSFPIQNFTVWLIMQANC